MKPFEVRLNAHDSFLKDGFLSTALFVGGDTGVPAEKHVVSSFAEIDELAARIAEKCNAAPVVKEFEGERGAVVWIGLAQRGTRKPNGFDAYARQLSRRFFSASCAPASSR